MDLNSLTWKPSPRGRERAYLCWPCGFLRTLSFRMKAICIPLVLSYLLFPTLVIILQFFFLCLECPFLAVRLLVPFSAPSFMSQFFGRLFLSVILEPSYHSLPGTCAPGTHLCFSTASPCCGRSADSPHSILPSETRAVDDLSNFCKL